MLSRLAESLYWIGRYIERADDTRASSTPTCTAWSKTPSTTRTRPVARVYSIWDRRRLDKPVTTEEMLQHIVYDADNPNSIAGSLSGAFENARRSREFISSEMWSR